MITKPSFITSQLLENYKNRDCKLGGLIPCKQNGSIVINELPLSFFDNVKELGLDYIITSYCRLESFTKNEYKSTHPDDQDCVYYNLYKYKQDSNFTKFLQTLQNAQVKGIDVYAHNYIFHSDWDGHYVSGLDTNSLEQALEYSSFRGIWIDEPSPNLSNKEDIFGRQVKFTDGMADYYDFIHNNYPSCELDVNLFAGHASGSQNSSQNLPEGIFYVIDSDGHITYNYNNNYRKYIDTYCTNSSIVGCDLYPIKYMATSLQSNGNNNKISIYVNKYKDSDGNIYAKKEKVSIGGQYTNPNTPNYLPLYRLENRKQRVEEWAITMNCLLSAYHDHPDKDYKFFISTSELLFYVKRDEIEIENGKEKTYTYFYLKEKDSTGQYKRIRVSSSSNSETYIKKSFIGSPISDDQNTCTNDIQYEVVSEDSISAEDFQITVWDTLPKITPEYLSLQCYCALISGVNDIRYFNLTDNAISYQFSKFTYRSSPFKVSSNGYEKNEDVWSIFSNFNNGKFKVLKRFISQKYIYGIDIYYNNKYVCENSEDININHITNLLPEFFDDSSFDDDTKFMVSIGFDNDFSYCFIVNIDFGTKVIQNTNNKGTVISETPYWSDPTLTIYRSENTLFVNSNSEGQIVETNDAYQSISTGGIIIIKKPYVYEDEYPSITPINPLRPKSINEPSYIEYSQYTNTNITDMYGNSSSIGVLDSLTELAIKKSINEVSNKPYIVSDNENKFFIIGSNVSIESSTLSGSEITGQLKVRNNYTNEIKTIIR